MLNEQDTDLGPEDGEYHFSDEGVYESHGEDEEAKAPTVTEKAGLGSSFASYRRFVVMGGIFAGVLLVVYLVMTPSNTPPATDITAATPPEVTTPAPQVAEKNKISQQALAEKTEDVPSNTEKPKPQEVVVEAAASAEPLTPPPSVQPLPSLAKTEFAASAQAPTTPAPLAEGKMLAALSPAAVDRLTALEESNNRMISQLNSEYARRLAEFETQDRVLQEQVKSLNAKLTSMEAAMAQMALQHQARPQQAPPSPPPTINIDNSNGPGQSGNAVMSLPQSSAMSPNKSNYSVQAIIPGRAWLRNESGDTLTVAEGDVLRGLGRVSKIDPYDGTIQIDTGTKVLTLTYGNGDYA